MSSKKNQSITADTRLTQSNFLNVSDTQHKSSNFMNHHIQHSENKQTDFLKIKNQHLHQRVNKMHQQIVDLESNKRVLLGLNEKYVKVVNEYYRKTYSKGTANSKSRGKPEIVPQKGQLQLKIKDRNKSSHQLLLDLEKDHRNLVKHCLAMEEQIKNYIQEMSDYNLLKDQLAEVNHTNAKELIEELRELTKENKLLKTQNNKVSYELEKSKQECSKLRKNRDQVTGRASHNGNQLQKYQCLINTIQQESKDKSRTYEAKIYQLEIKVQKLEKQLRRDQEWTEKTLGLRRNLEIQKVENVHQCDKLKKDISELLNYSKKSLNTSVKLNTTKKSAKNVGSYSFYEA